MAEKEKKTTITKKIREPRVKTPPVEEVVTPAPAAPAQRSKRRLIAPIVAALLVAGAFTARYKSLFIAALVDGRPITRYELDRRLEKLYGQRTLDDMVTVLLIKSELAKNKIAIPPSDVDAKIAEIEKELSGMSLDEALKAQDMTRNDLNEQVSIQLGMEKLLSSKVTVTDKEISDYVTNFSGELKATDDAGRRVEAEGVLRNQKMQESIGEWVNGLSSKAKILKFI